MTSAPEPGSPAAIDEERREREYAAERAAERAEEDRKYKKRNRDEKLAIMASVIAGGMVTGDSAPTDVAVRAVDIALHILDRVEKLP